MALKKSQTSQPLVQEERKAPRDCASLAAQLASTDPMERRWAARDLLECPGATGPLVARLKEEEDLSVREVILTTLTRLGEDEAVQGLVDCLRSQDAALRNQALEAMKQLPEEVAPIMRGLLRDADPDVRIFAVNVLESLRHPSVETWLIEVIERDPHVNVCSAALDLLTEVGTPAAQQALSRVKARFAGEPYVQFVTDLALRRIHEG
jgi:HEAT repeat protein